MENVFAQSSGGSETGGFYLSGWSNASGDLIQIYMPSLSRGATPVSVTPTTTSGPTNIAAVSTGHLDGNGFQLFSTSSSAQVSNLQAGGTWSISY